MSGIVATAQGDIANYNKELDQQQALLDLATGFTSEHTARLAELTEQEKKLQDQGKLLREQRSL
nr:MAG TPA: hypothetical protein [Caudoviricetes sp.]